MSRQMAWQVGMDGRPLRRRRRRRATRRPVYGIQARRRRARGAGRIADRIAMWAGGRG
ncbi:hypothetical protein [Streptacidiphilus sp. EB129]|uniref:hypothetical protein n=1 Tax=Streptacidiphilus sp. EB129 TaxID=3156262 RepID=UPI003512037B